MNTCIVGGPINTHVKYDGSYLQKLLVATYLENSTLTKQPWSFRMVYVSMRKMISIEALIAMITV